MALSLSSTSSSAGPDLVAPANFRRFSWFLGIYTLLAIAWGVIVRATGSGDGCGNNWPLCNGEVLPVFANNERLFEFLHRASTGLMGPLVVVLAVWAVRLFPKGALIRKAAFGVFAMTMVEAFIGAVLVRQGWVDMDTSAGRVVVMGLHMISTFLLVGFMTAVLWLATTGKQIAVKGQGAVSWMLAAAMAAVGLLGISGGLSALGHQLWPSDDVLKAAADSASPILVRLQPLHPTLGVTVGLLVLLTVGLVLHLRPNDEVRRASKLVAAVFGTEMLIGVATIFLKAPVWMQALHLVVADLVFATLIVLALSAFAVSSPRRELEGETAEAAPELKGKQLAGAYFSLTKPRVISLLLFTTMTAAFAAAGGWPGFWVFVSLLIGGYMSAGAANAINMVIDRDIDGTMARTAKRPTVTQAIPSTNALYFAGALGWGSFGILALGCNLLTAMLSLAGLVFYVIVYTLVLKRRTWQNIVIGGAAGAFPPLVGWAGVTGSLTPLAIYLFAIILVWTPVHFWALALLIKDEYASVGVPMLPVVKGERATVVQIAIYTAVTVAVTTLPYFQGFVGVPYLAAATLLNAGLIWLTLRLYRQVDRTRALVVFKYSMLYLAILFLMVAVDRAASA